MSEKDNTIWREWLKNFDVNQRSTIANRLMWPIRQECEIAKGIWQETESPFEVVKNKLKQHQSQDLRYGRVDPYNEMLIVEFEEAPELTKKIVEIVYNRERNRVFDRPQRDKNVGRPATQKQINFIRKLGYEGEITSVKHASAIIASRLGGRRG